MPTNLILAVIWAEQDESQKLFRLQVGTSSNDLPICFRVNKSSALNLRNENHKFVHLFYYQSLSFYVP